MAKIRAWRGACLTFGMVAHIKLLFTIKTKFEAFLLIYVLGLGAVERGLTGAEAQ